MSAPISAMSDFVREVNSRYGVDLRVAISHSGFRAQAVLQVDEEAGNGHTPSTFEEAKLYLVGQGFEVVVEKEPQFIQTGPVEIGDEKPELIYPEDYVVEANRSVRLERREPGEQPQGFIWAPWTPKTSAAKPKPMTDVEKSSLLKNIGLANDEILKNAKRRPKP